MINKVILVGRVGKDPETKHLDNNMVVSRFTLATSESYKNKNGEKVTNTEWHNIVVWRGLAEIAEKYVKKGQMLYLEGKIHTRSWDDKEGKKHYSTEIDAENFQMLGGKPDSSRTEQTPAQSQPTTNEPVNDFIPDTPEGDLPF